MLNIKFQIMKTKFLYLTIIFAMLFAISSCGKKGPLKPPSSTTNNTNNFHHS
ncbi:MAG: hypothetical protein HRU36_06050 [Rickettsiales bacterium]|nr:hypothetical protein [Rickettsiales bacterium]